MKQRSTTPVSIPLTTKAVLVGMTVMISGVGVLHAAPYVFARDYDAEISAKQREADRYQQEVNRLAGEATTLQGELDTINNQVAQIKSQIDVNQSKHDKLVKEIEVQKKTIERNKKALGRILSDMYVGDQITPLEMLASSSTIGDYIDKQEQRSGLRSSLNGKIKDIRDLQKQLEESRKEVEKILAEQNIQKADLDSKQATQKDLLNKTKGDEAAYQGLVQDRQGEIDGLRRQQEELVRLRSQGAGGGKYITAPGGGGGGYPWGHIVGCYTEACADPWRLFYSECTSYVAWKLSSQGYGVQSFAGQGHAYQWPSTTSTWKGVSQSSTPKDGAAAVFPANTNGAAWTGHVMYVEQVYGNGTILISEYNWDGRGSFSTRELSPSEYSGTTFISFPRA